MEADLPLSAGDGARRIRAALGSPRDLVLRDLGPGTQVLYLSTITDHRALARDLVAPGAGPPGALPASAADITPVRTCRDAVEALLAAKAVVLAEGRSGCWAVAAERWPARPVSEPPSETAAHGPHEGFVEALDTNLALLRHRVPDARLRWAQLRTGRRSGSRGALVYMQGVVAPGVLARLRRALRRMEPSFATDAAMLEEWLAPRAGRFFPTIGRTERPDRAAAAVLGGRIVILTSGSPTALVVPHVFADLLHVPEDYYERPFSTDVVRAVRTLGLGLSLIASPLFVAFGTVNQELIPTRLYISIAQARRGVPIPLTIEVLMLEVVVDLIRQAGLRLPGSIGQSISIIGAVVIGQSAVTAGLISAPTIVIVAFSFIASFAVPASGLVDAVRAVRFPLIVLAAAFGLFGVSLGLLVLFGYLCSLESFGVPYMSPLTPLRPKGLQDALWRRAAPRLRRPFTARPSRQGGRP